MTFSHQLNDTGSKILPHEKEKKSVVFYHFYSSSETLRQLCLIENHTPECIKNTLSTLHLLRQLGVAS